MAESSERETQASEPTRTAGAPSPLRIGELLRRNGLIDHDDLALALSEQELRSDSPPLGRVLLHLGAIDEATLTAALAEQFGMRVVDLRREADPDPSVLARITREAAFRLQALPLRYEDGQLVVVVAEPPTREARREISMLSGRQPVFVLASAQALGAALDRWFPHPSTLVADLPERPDAALDAEPLRQEVRSRRSASAGVRVDDRVVAWLLAHAGDLGATSVHLVEGPSELSIRVRVDRGMLETAVLPATAGSILVRRVLAASGIELESSEAQRGSIPAVPGDRCEWQVRSLPQSSGRVVVLRPKHLEMAGRATWPTHS
jgi:type II secretory ATPase GspE/PulE/Tfp pilus assembly ATPase PilB-like protein